MTKNPEDSGFETDVCGIQGPGAYQDGHVSVARLNNPQQILSMHDPETGEKVIYICDANNNCVRMYNMETKLMSTVAGIGEIRICCRKSYSFKNEQTLWYLYNSRK